DAPEVEGIPGLELLRVPPAPAKPDTADELVHPAAQRPGERERVPAVLATDALDDRPELRGRRIRFANLEIGEDGVACPLGVARQWVARCALDRCVLPARLDVAVAHLRES